MTGEQGRTITVDEELYQDIIAATRDGRKTTSAIIREALTPRSPPRAYSESPYQRLPPPPPRKDFREMLQDMVETKAQVSLMNAMDRGGGDEPSHRLSPEMIADAVAKVLDERLGKKDEKGGGNVDPMKSVEMMLAHKAQLKILQDFSADNPGESKFLASQIADLTKRIDAANERTVAAEREALKKEIETANMNSAQLREEMQREREATEARFQQLADLRNQGNDSPKGGLAEIKENVKTYNELKGLFGGGGGDGKPDMWDRVERVIDKGGELLGKGLEGVAAVEAGKRGVPPRATLASPQGPSYLPDEGAPPSPGTSPDATIQMPDGRLVRVADLPENPPGGYVLTDSHSGESRQVTKDEWVRMLVAAQRAGAPVAIQETPGTVPPPAPLRPPAPAQMPHQHLPPPAPKPKAASKGPPTMNPWSREVIGAPGDRNGLTKGTTPLKELTPPPEPEPTPEVPPPAPEEPQGGPEPEQNVEIPPGALGLPGAEPITVDAAGRIVRGAAPDPTDQAGDA